MKKEFIRNGLTGKTDHILTLQPVPRKDAPGIVATYYYTSPEFARNYTLTIQGLLNGYSVQKDGTIIVTDEGSIVASNDESLLGQQNRQRSCSGNEKAYRQSAYLSFEEERNWMLWNHAEAE